MNKPAGIDRMGELVGVRVQDALKLRVVAVVVPLAEAPYGTVDAESLISVLPGRAPSEPHMSAKRWSPWGDADPGRSNQPAERSPVKIGVREPLGVSIRRGQAERRGPRRSSPLSSARVRRFYRPDQDPHVF
jgi:hypothetical protein